MREKLKSRKKRIILIASTVIVITLIAVGICLENNKTFLTIKKVDKIDKDITKLDVNEEKKEIILEEKIEDKGEESATEEEVKTEVSNTPKSKDNKKTNSNTKTNTSNSNNQNTATANNNQTTQQSTIKQEEVVNNNSNSSSNSSSSNQVQQTQTNNESTDLYNSITHGQWENDINDNESLCEAKGNRIANNELKEILDWNEQHEDELKQPIINYSRCYPVIKDGVKHWYLHFFTTKGEGMDTEIKNKYNF